MGLYIQMHSMHGLTRAQHLELGRDEDTGGQILYVRYLALELGKMDEVDRVDIIVRRIKDKEYPGYDDIIEPVSPKVNIVRIECGPEKYILKTDLWPHLNEFIKNCRDYISDLGYRPDILHSNYADSGYVCARLSQELDIPHVHTGHSLGKPKMARLGVTDKNFAAMDQEYHFSERLKAEQHAIDNADAIVVSTNEERLFQYNMYDVDVSDSRFKVISPGANLNKFYPPDNEGKTEWDLLARERLMALLEVELAEPEKPMLFSISRLDFRKNLISLVKAFAFDKELHGMSNLVMVTGTLGQMGKHEQILMDEIDAIVSKYGLAEKVCIIRHLSYKTEGGEIYRLAAESRGIFVNPAFHEPFGITVLEAGASGLPVVATNSGGPVEIIEKCACGLLVEPRNTRDIAGKCKEILRDPEKWQRFSKNGIYNITKQYSWEVTARKELELFQELIAARLKLRNADNV